MAQQLPSDYPIDPTVTSGTALADILNRTSEVLNSNNSGATRPSTVKAGGLWTKTGGAALELYLFDGTTDVFYSAIGPAGPQGPAGTAGPAGPNAVSTNAGNITKLGTDGLVFTPPQSSIPKGSVMLFVQTTAPVGFTKSAAHNNKALRVVSGTAGSGGSVAFTTAFASKAVSGTVANGTAGGTVANGTAGGTVANTTLSTSMSASHTHTYTLRFGTYTGGGYPGFDGSGDRLVDAAATTGASDGGGGGAHGHGFTGAAHNHGFTGAAHGHGFTGTAIDLAVQYVDVIICTKD